MKKLFALLCVIALLGALCIPTMAATERVAVAAQVPSDWATPHLYAWGTAEEVAWPGIPMTKIDDWYVAYMNADNTNVIINNGSNGPQTADLTVTPGQASCIVIMDLDNVSVGDELPFDVPAEDAMPKPETDTIIAKVPADWTSASLYAWAGGGASTNAGWPGVAMTLNDEGLWVGEVTPGFENIIVTAGADGPQTIDLPYKGGDAWVALREAGADGKLTAAVTYEDPKGNWDFEGDKVESDGWYVAGTMNEWNQKDDAYKMTDNGDGTFTLKFTVSAGNHALKVTNGTWVESYGGEGADGNYEFGKSADGEITVNFNANDKVVTVEGVDEIAPPDVTYYVAGIMNDWKENDEAYKMSKTAEGTYVFSFNATPGDYALKVTNGTWEQSWGGEGADGNYEFNVSDEGNVNIKFDGSTVSHDFEEAPEVVTDPTTPEKPEKPQKDKEPVDTTLLISIISTAVILIGGAVAVFFVLKKKN